MIARRGSIDLGNCTLSPRWRVSIFLFLSLPLSSVPLFFVYTIYLPLLVVVSSLPPLLRPFYLEFSLSRLRTPVPGLGASTVGFRVMRASLSLSFSLASISVLSVHPSFLPPARERLSPSGSKPKNLRKTLLSRLDISRLPTDDQFHDHRDPRHLRRRSILSI